MVEEHSDGITMNAVEWLIFLILTVTIAVAVFGAYILFFSPFSLNDVIQWASNILSPLYHTWTAIPEALRAIILTAFAAIPTLFFAWTKARAMNKLEEVKQQASTQVNQLEGEKKELQNQLTLSSTQGIDDLVQTSNKLRGTIEQQATTIQGQSAQIERMQRDYNTMETTYQNMINELKMKEKVVVK